MDTEHHYADIASRAYEALEKFNKRAAIAVLFSFRIFASTWKAANWFIRRSRENIAYGTAAAISVTEIKNDRWRCQPASRQDLPQYA